MTDELDYFDPGVNIGTAELQCPECGQLIPVRVKAQLGILEDGRQTLITDPDMTDLWAHSWIHGDTRWVEDQYDHD